MKAFVRTFAGAWALVPALAVPAAQAQTLSSTQAAIAAIFARIEGNLVDAEAIGMNYRVWKAKSDAIHPRVDELGQRYAQENAYCQGTYEHDEYVRRKAACEATFSQLDALKAQLQPEVEGLQEEGLKLQQRDTARQAEAQQLQDQLVSAIVPLVTLCGAMSHDVAVRDCHLPPAPGPRTREMVAAMEASLVGQAVTRQ